MFCIIRHVRKYLVNYLTVICLNLTILWNIKHVEAYPRFSLASTLIVNYKYNYTYIVLVTFPHFISAYRQFHILSEKRVQSGGRAQSEWKGDWSHASGVYLNERPVCDKLSQWLSARDWEPRESRDVTTWLSHAHIICAWILVRARPSLYRQLW